MYTRFRAVWPVLAMTTAVIASNAHASGFALIEQSASGMGTAFAGAGSSAQDASTIFFNPAGMTYLDSGSHYVIGGHFISLNADFQDEGSQSMLGTPLTGKDDNGGKTAVVPNLYLVTDLNDQWRFGLGVSVPFGLSTEYDSDWIGRYHAIESSLSTININPSFAFKANDRLSLGFGLNAQYIDVTLSSAVDFGTICSFYSPIACTDGFAEITGDNWGYGWNVGLLYDLGDATRLGLAYRSNVKHDIEGNADFTVPATASFLTVGGMFTDQNAQASVDLPGTLTASVHHHLNDQLNIMADISWTQWSLFDELRIEYPDSVQDDSVTTENWRDTWRVAVGADYRSSDKLTLRGGLAYDQGPVPDDEHRTPRVPDGDRTWLALGVGYELSKSTSVDVGYSHLFVPEVRTNNTTEGQLQYTLTGNYESSVDILSVQINGKF